ncbi:sensor histidine kinase [Chamaesiphon sp.]|uniref:sensor histidine kinase n=1 Tax=Chamaesiphon sp. TaxID=2814140 RepID=UPI0035941FA4
MHSHIDSTYLCQLTAAQIQEILVLNGVLIQQYQPQLHRWLTLAQLPDIGQLTLSLEPDKAAEIDRRLHEREIVEFTAMTTVMNINICDRYIFVPLLEQPDVANHERIELWGRICLIGNLNSVWTAQDLSWVQALGQQLLTAMNILSRFTATNRQHQVKSSPLSDLAELIERIAELESKCQQKDEFINHISHDLRAPLMNIKMAMRMLKTSLDADPQIAELLSGHRAEKYLEILEQECDREVDLINNILELQRLELAIEPVEIEPVEIGIWLSTTIEPFRHRARSDRQRLSTAVSESISTLEVDRFGLTKILTELLNNACKYTQVDGQIIVAIDGDPHSEWLTIVVKNQTEIAAKHLPHIFEQFYRIPGSDRSRQGGSGLGLALVQKLVRQLNGQIQVASTGGWTEFAVKLPVSGRVRSLNVS